MRNSLPRGLLDVCYLLAALGLQRIMEVFVAGFNSDGKTVCLDYVLQDQPAPWAHASKILECISAKNKCLKEVTEAV